jgi:hypothetical protein
MKNHSNVALQTVSEATRGLQRSTTSIDTRRVCIESVSLTNRISVPQKIVEPRKRSGHAWTISSNISTGHIKMKTSTISLKGNF